MTTGRETGRRKGQIRHEGRAGGDCRPRVPATLRVIFLLAGMRTASPAAILTFMALRCIIVDDNTGFLRSARLLLEREGIEVMAVASTGDEAQRLSDQLQPDVVLVDVDLGTESGFDVAGRLQGRAGASPPDVILISLHAEEDLADLIAISPVQGFIGKSLLSARAIHDVLERPRRS
jgi:CheY-like chemotaxis protein